MIEWSAGAPGRSRRLGSADLTTQSADLGGLVLSPSRALQVRIVGDQQQPIAGARIVLRASGSFETDAEGRANISDAPTDAIEAEIRAIGFLTENVTIPALKEEAGVATAAELTFALRRGAGVVGDLLLKDSAAPPDSVDVVIRSNGRVTTRSVAISERFELYGLQPGHTRLRIAPRGGLPFETPERELIAGEVWDLGVQWIESGFAIRGMVVDEEGQPIDRATVRALRTGDHGPALAYVMNDVERTTTEKDGTFLVTNLKPGPQFAIIEAPGHVPAVRTDLTLESDAPSRTANIGKVELARGRRLRVSCRPLARCGTEAMILLAGRQFPFVTVATPVEHGVAEFAAAPPGRWSLRLTKGQTMLHEADIEVARNRELTEVEIELPSVRVDGDVTVGSRAARGGEVVFRLDTGSDMIPIFMTGDTPSGTSLSTRITATLGATMSAEVRNDGTFGIDSMSPGTWKVLYRGQSGATSPVSVVIPDTSAHFVPLRYAGGEIAGMVRDDRGAPTVASVKVVDPRGAQHHGATNSDGQFRIAGVSAGRSTLSARGRAGVATATVDLSEGGANEVQLVLEPEGRRELQVQSLSPQGMAAGGSSAFLETVELVRMATADATGTARFAIQDSIEQPRLAAHHYAFGWAFNSNGKARVDFAAATGSLVVSLKQGGLVEIYGPTGFPLHRALPLLGTATVVGPATELRLDRLPRGPYFVRSAGRGEGVTIQAGKTARVAF